MDKPGLRLHSRLPAFLLVTIWILLVFMPLKHSRAQTGAFCPLNTAFELGSFALWSCDTGQATAPASLSAAPVFTPGPPSGPVGGRHTITGSTGFSTDKYGGFPVLAPGGGQYGVRLGNDSAGGKAERLRYFIRVPFGFNDYSIQYRYAAVLDDTAGGVPGTKPAFRIAVLDSATQLPINNGCTGQMLTVGGGGPAFQQSTVAPFPKYIPWTSAALNLSGQGGKTLIIEVTSFDGVSGSQFGYGYFDIVSCGRFEARFTFCNLDRGYATVEAPPGYASYTWYRGALGTVPLPATTSSFNIFPLPVTPTVFYCVATPFPGQGCNDTLQSKPMSDFTMYITPDVVCRNFGPILLNVHAFGGLDSFSYHWRPHPGLYLWQDPFSGWLDPSKAFATIGVSPAANLPVIAMVTDTIGCFHTDTVWFQSPSYRVALGSDTTICLGMSLDLKPKVTPANSSYSHTWSPGRSLSDSASLNPRYTPSATGVEMLVLRVDSAYCAVTDTIRIRTLPNTCRAVDTAVCSGAVFLAGVFSEPLLQDSMSYGWSPATNLSLSGNGRQPQIRADTTISYTVTMSYPGCPDVIDTLELRAEPVPVVSLGMDSLAKCFGAIVPLSASVAPAWFGSYDYSWRFHTALDSPYRPMALFAGNEDTTLLLTVRTPLGCTGTDSVYVDARPRNFGRLSPGDTAICPGDVVRMAAGGGASYRWGPGRFLSDSASASVTATITAPIRYQVYVADDIGCTDTLAISLELHEHAAVSLPDTTYVTWGQALRMNPATNGKSFVWSPEAGLSNPNIQDPVARPDSSTLYLLEAATGAGCRATDSTYVVVQSAIFLPNAFAPGNGINPAFAIIHTGIRSLQRFSIYNRWGNRVFETKDIRQGWDGRYNGQPQPMGVYVYVVEATGMTGELLKKQGNVTLIR